MLVAIALFIIGGIGAGIASSKGRNPWGWFALCFLFSLIALIVLLFLPNLKKKELKSTKQCPKCAERVLNEASICKHCSYEFDSVTMDKPSSVNESLGI